MNNTRIDILIIIIFAIAVATVLVAVVLVVLVVLTTVFYHTNEQQTPWGVDIRVCIIRRFPLNAVFAEIVSLPSSLLYHLHRTAPPPPYRTALSNTSPICLRLSLSLHHWHDLYEHGLHIIFGAICSW